MVGSPRRLTPRAWVRAELATLAALSGASLALEYGVFSNTPTWVDATLLGHFLWFALGMGMAVISAALSGEVIGHRTSDWLTARPGRRLDRSRSSCYVALCAWLPATPFIADHGQGFVSALVFGLASTLILVPAVFAEHAAGSVPVRVLGQPVIAWIGLISYGIFLWHYAIALDLGFIGHKNPFGIVLLGTVAIVIPVAAASYYLVERPILRLKYRTSSPASLRSASGRTPRARARRRSTPPRGASRP